LLDSSKLRSGHTQLERRAMPLGPIVNDALEYLAPLAQENQIDISRQLPPDLPPVLIDEDKISRVFINLLDNALKFAPQGGQVTLLAERWQTGSDQKFVRCAVRDNGPGIPLELRERIFDRFVQVTDQMGRRRGSGLGLNFCLLAVEAHGGKIWVDDAPNGGSEFSFTLPVASNGDS
jgi:signal transduction histidine kinase